jgi:hypothetical protein
LLYVRPCPIFCQWKSEIMVLIVSFCIFLFIVDIVLVLHWGQIN